MKYVVPFPLSVTKQLNVFLIVLLLLASVASTASAEPIKIRISHGASDDTPRAKMAMHFRSLVQQRLGNSVAVVDINNSLVSDQVVTDDLLQGKVDIGVPLVSDLQKYSSRFKLFDLPFLFVSPDAAYSFVKGEYGDRFVNLMSQHGFVGFGFLNDGMKQFSSSDEIIFPRDLRKLRVNALGEGVINAKMELFKAKVMKVPNEELYDLLKKEEVDAQESTWATIFSNKFYEHQPYMLESNHGYLGYMVLASQNFWKEVPEDTRKVLRQSLKEAIDLGNAIALENEQADRLNILSTKKTIIHSITVAERRKWVNAVKPSMGRV